MLDDGSSSSEQGVGVREVHVSYPSPLFAYPLPPSPVPVSSSSSFPSSAIPCAIRARLHCGKQTLVVGSYVDARYQCPPSEGNSVIKVVEYL